MKSIKKLLPKVQTVTWMNFIASWKNYPPQKKMPELMNIAHPFLTVDDFRRRVGKKLARLIHRLAGRYPQLHERCGRGRMLLALSVAWGMSGMAQAGDIAAFDHIDEALQPIVCLGGIKPPPSGYILVEGQPYHIDEGTPSELRFLWDGFAIFIDSQGVEVVSQVFFDIAASRVKEAYGVMDEENREMQLLSSQAEVSVEQEDSEGQMSGRVVCEPVEKKQKSLALRMVETAIENGDIQAIEQLELQLLLQEGDEEADACRRKLTQRRKELYEMRKHPAEYHFNGSVGQFIARGNGVLVVKNK